VPYVIAPISIVVGYIAVNIEELTTKDKIERVSWAKGRIPGYPVASLPCNNGPAFVHAGGALV